MQKVDAPFEGYYCEESEQALNIFKSLGYNDFILNKGFSTYIHVDEGMIQNSTVPYAEKYLTPMYLNEEGTGFVRTDYAPF